MNNNQPQAIQRLRATNIHKEELTSEDVFEGFSTLVWRCSEKHTDCDSCHERFRCFRLFKQLSDKSAEGKLLVNGRYRTEAAEIAEKLLNILAKALGESLDEDKLLMEAIEEGNPELQASG